VPGIEAAPKGRPWRSADRNTLSFRHQPSDAAETATVAPVLPGGVLGALALVALRALRGRLIGGVQSGGLADRLTGLEVGHHNVIFDSGNGDLLENRDVGHEVLLVVTLLQHSEERARTSPPP
jgi:hypothetical protein